MRERVHAQLLERKSGHWTPDAPGAGQGNDEVRVFMFRGDEGVQARPA
jgi:hypothetical protein